MAKRNTYFEAVLKQVGFDDLVARKINEYRDYHAQKVRQVENFYVYLKENNATLEITKRSFFITNPIERYHVLYENSTLIEEFVAEINTYFDGLTLK